MAIAAPRHRRATSGRGPTTVPSSDAGSDSLVGGAGDDLLIGGLGNDTIQVGLNHGRGLILGFDAAGNDVVALDLGAAMDSFAEVQAALRKDGGDVVLDTGATSSIRFKVATLADFTIDDFVFL